MEALKPSMQSELRSRGRVPQNSWGHLGLGYQAGRGRQSTLSSYLWCPLKEWGRTGIRFPHLFHVEEWQRRPHCPSSGAAAGSHAAHRPPAAHSSPTTTIPHQGPPQHQRCCSEGCQALPESPLSLYQSKSWHQLLSRSWRILESERERNHESFQQRFATCSPPGFPPATLHTAEPGWEQPAALQSTGWDGGGHRARQRFLWVLHQAGRAAGGQMHHQELQGLFPATLM